MSDMSPASADEFEPALEIRGLSKEYRRGVPVLTNVDLKVASTAITAVIGPSGTGKSTLIRCINRLVEPSAGEIVFQGQDLVKLDRKALRLARRQIGMVFQEYNLVERLTVMENLLCGRLGYVPAWKAWMRKYPQADIDRAFSLLDTVGLSGFANQRAGTHACCSAADSNEVAGRSGANVTAGSATGHHAGFFLCPGLH